MKIVKWIIIAFALTIQGLGVITPVLFRAVPGYGKIFRQLWERHKNPVSWICRPFFGLAASYGAIMNNSPLILVSIIALGTSWFWFPRSEKTPKWAEDFINKELEIMTPENPRDFKRVILPSLGTPLLFGSFLVILWLLTYPWNWLALLVYVLLSLTKIGWSVRLEQSIAWPLLVINLIGYALGIGVGIPLFLLSNR